MSDAPSTTADLRDALRVVYIVDGPAAGDGDRLDAVLASGVTSLWLRAPDLNGARLYRVALDLLARCRAHGACLVVGDRADVAMAVGAHGVQVGHRSPPAARLRAFVSLWLGVSCHTEEELASARAAGADFAVLSPVFGVPAKGPPLGPAAFGRLRRRASIPVVALGGIDAEGAAAVREAGADGVAVIRALRDADDPAAEARRIARAVTTS